MNPRRVFAWPPLWILLGTLALVAATALRGKSASVEGFVSAGAKVLDQAAPVILLATGMTLVIATGGVDLSVGSTLAIAGSITATLFGQKEWSLAASIAMALAVGIALGLFNGFLVSKLGVQPIVATLILMVAGRGIAQLISDGQILFVRSPIVAALDSRSVAIAVAAAVVIAALTRLTGLALFIESVGNNRTAAELAGVPSTNIILLCYGTCGVCAALAGIVTMADLRAADSNLAGVGMELDAILAVALGGTALAGGRYYLIGSVLGAIALAALRILLQANNVPDEQATVVKALLVLGVCLTQAPAFWRMLRGSR